MTETTNQLNVFDSIEDSSFFKPQISPGVHHVHGMNVELKTNDKGNEYIAFKLENSHKSMEFEWRLFLSEGAMPISLKNVKHVLITNFADADLKKITATTHKDLLLKMTNALVGKEWRMKFCGEEYVNKDGNLRVRTTVGFAPFAESLSIPDAETALRYDESNKYDLKRLPEEMKQSLESDSKTSDAQSKIDTLGV